MPKKKAKKSARSRSARSKADPLGQVKELLFGAELTAHKQRSRSAELRLQKKLERDGAALTDRVAKLSQRVTKTKKGLDDAIVKARRELREEVAAAVGELQSRTDDMLAEVERRLVAMLRDVQKGAADRQALAALFADLARRVGGSKRRG